MPHSLPASRGADLRALRHELSGARDEQLSRVVAMVDAMPERGEADGLIAPLRTRLARMGVERRLSFTRLLFLPLDPVIVPPTRWKRGMPCLPRNVLTALAGYVRAAMGQAAAELEGDLALAPVRAAARGLPFGRALWGAAAEVLAAAEPPPGWTAATGLPAADFAALARPCAAVLRHAAPLHAMLAALSLGEEPDIALLEAMLREAGAEGVGSFALVAAVLLARLPGCEPVLALTDELGATGPARVAADEVVNRALDRMEVSPDASLPQATAALRADMALLQGLEARAGQRPSRQAQLRQARQRLDMQCQVRFAAELPDRLLAPAAAIARANDAEIESLEAAARELRRFGQIAGTLGHAAAYDRALSEAAQALRPRAGEPTETLADRVRLTEILAGPEAALALLR